jgi:hypothetical protein
LRLKFLHTKTTQPSGGGVALYLKENMRYKVVVRSTPTSVVDYLFVELKLPYPILVCTIYPPNINGFSIFGPEFESLVSKYSDVLVLGDFSLGGSEKLKSKSSFSCLN